jgi:hypothetical protein
MEYNKPQVKILGDATLLIQGSKTLAGDSASMEVQIAQDCELED